MIVGRHTAACDILEAEALLVDWDGCVMMDDAFLPGADIFLRRFERKITIVSNNSTDLPTHFATRLQNADIRIPASRILLAGHQTLHHAASVAGGKRVHLIGCSTMHVYAKGLGLNLVEDDPDLMLLLRDPAFDYGKLQKAMDCLRLGADLLVANSDATHPKQGGVVPETGALLAAILAGAPDVRPQIFGKPAPFLFEAALKAVGLTADRAVMIGDNQLTDIQGAERIGMKSVLVGPQSGLSLSFILEAVRQIEFRPTAPK